MLKKITGFAIIVFAVSFNTFAFATDPAPSPQPSASTSSTIPLTNTTSSQTTVTQQTQLYQLIAQNAVAPSPSPSASASATPTKSPSPATTTSTTSPTPTKSPSPTSSPSASPSPATYAVILSGSVQLAPVVSQETNEEFSDGYPCSGTKTVTKTVNRYVRHWTDNRADEWDHDVDTRFVEVYALGFHNTNTDGAGIAGIDITVDVTRTYDGAHTLTNSAGNVTTDRNVSYGGTRYFGIIYTGEAHDHQRERIDFSDGAENLTIIEYNTHTHYTSTSTGGYHQSQVIRIDEDITFNINQTDGQEMGYTGTSGKTTTSALYNDDELSDPSEMTVTSQILTYDGHLDYSNFYSIEETTPWENGIALTDTTGESIQSVPVYNNDGSVAFFERVQQLANGLVVSEETNDEASSRGDTFEGTLWMWARIYNGITT
jgi:hypothetical protein